MKAIVVGSFGGPEVLELRDLPNPVAGAGQVVVAVRAVGVNPYEAYMRTGTYAIKPPLPYTPGADAAGVVESVGQGVRRFSVGERVYTIGSLTGTYAEKTLCDESQVCALPDRVSFSQGAGLNVPFGTAYRALFDRARAEPGETVLIHGATGGVGSAAVQIALSAGMTVFATGGSDAGRAMLKEQGVRNIFDHTADGYIHQIKDATGGKGIDVVLEMLANVNLQKDLELIAKFGRIVVIGNRGKVEIDPRLAMGKEAAVLGMTYWGAGIHAVARAHAYIGAGLRDGSLSPIYGTEMPLSRAAEAHAKILQPGTLGKIVLIP